MTTPEHDSTEELAAVETEPTASAESMSTAETEQTAPTEEPARPRRRRTALVAGIAAVLVLGGGAAAVASAHKTVEVDVDGRTVSVSTFAGDVGNVLDAEGIAVGEHDLVVPAVDEPLTDGAEIVVRSAEQVLMNVDGNPSQVWTVGDTAAQALATITASGDRPVREP